MLIQTARMMTENKLKGKIPVDEAFIVFAKDTHSYDGLGKLFLKCGASKESVKKWATLGWL